MLTKTQAIVLHSIKYGETRLIVDMFTKEYGRLSFIVSLPKSPKSKIKKQYFQPLAMLEIETDVRPRLQLQKLSDVRLLHPFSTIPFSQHKLSISLFVAEFLYYALRGEQQNALLFDYIVNSLQWLDGQDGRFANFHLVFLMRLSRFLVRMDFPTMHLFQMSHTERNRLLEVALSYYRLHLPDFPELKSLTVLQELYES